MITLAFYKGRRRLCDRIACFVTRSPYSHVEMLIGDPTDSPVMSVTASSRDGGVKERRINFTPAHWDTVGVPWAPPDALQRMREQLGKPYDYLGLFGSQFLNLRRQQQSKWFCSELCAHALGMGEPHRYAPGDLMRQIIERNELFARKK